MRKRSQFSRVLVLGPPIRSDCPTMISGEGACLTGKFFFFWHDTQLVCMPRTPSRCFRKGPLLSPCDADDPLSSLRAIATMQKKASMNERIVVDHERGFDLPINHSFASIFRANASVCIGDCFLCRKETLIHTYPLQIRFCRTEAFPESNPGPE
jgi:hypothetical protein